MSDFNLWAYRSCTDPDVFAFHDLLILQAPRRGERMLNQNLQLTGKVVRARNRICLDPPHVFSHAIISSCDIRICKNGCVS